MQYGIITPNYKGRRQKHNRYLTVRLTVSKCWSPLLSVSFSWILFGVSKKTVVLLVQKHCSKLLVDQNFYNCCNTVRVDWGLFPSKIDFYEFPEELVPRYIWFEKTISSSHILHLSTTAPGLIGWWPWWHLSRPNSIEVGQYVKSQGGRAQRGFIPLLFSVDCIYFLGEQKICSQTGT